MTGKKYFVINLLCAAIILSAIGCGRQKDYNDGKNYYSASNAKNGNIKSSIVNSYDTSMKAVVKYNNTDIGIVILIDISTGTEYTMTYNSNIQVIDRYGKDKTISYIKNGDIINAYYLKNAIQLTGVEYADDVWEYSDADNWEVDTASHSITIYGNKYYYNEDEIFVLSEGNTIEFQDLSNQDKLSIRGIGNKAVSINVDKGHGYIKLAGVDKFLDGWVQVGKTIKPISKDMMLVAPEGTYDVKIVKDGYGGSVSATVQRNQEVTLDFSDVTAKIVQYGTVEFIILPENVDAVLKIAGQETNYNNPVLLEYDSYRVTVEAEGYETYTGTLKVGQNLSQIKIKLTKIEQSSSASASPSASPSSSPSPTAGSTDKSDASASPTASPTVIVTATETPQESGSKTITITDPEGVNVYFDDEYKGVAPVSFPKISGTHTLTLSKDGYQTKSYTLDVSASDENVTYCMPALATN